MPATCRNEDQRTLYHTCAFAGRERTHTRVWVAGFGLDDLNIVSQDNSLVISGKAQDSAEKQAYLHRGIARRAFQRRFELADHIKVAGASLENGLLHVDLVREVPEERKPRTIAISSSPRGP